jgi:molybdopterin synthase sulfur carrier subunit
VATVNLRAPLKQRVGAPSVEVPGATVGEVVRELETQAPAIKGWVTDEQGLIRRHVNVFVNGEPATAEDVVRADDSIDIIHAITGGRR